MSNTARRRVLVVAPSGRDGPLAHQLLARVGLESVLCASVKALCDEARTSAGVCVIAEEAFDADGIENLAKLLAHQPVWSDLPIVFINNRRPGRRSATFEQLLATANVNFLERPIHASSFVSAVKSALRARERQYAGESAILQRDGFLAMLSHELRNPLAAIVLGLELIGEDPSGPPPREHLERLRRQSRNLTQLVGDLLEVSRITSGRIVLQKQRLDVGELVRAAIAGLPDEASRARVELAEVPRGLVISGDELRLNQVLTNLLTNALKYTPPPGRIRVLTRVALRAAHIAIQDEGIGIAPHMLSRVFDLFVQADGALARSQGGMGIGLTLARNLVELHGGHIAAESAGLGHGSTFEVTLPLLEDVTVEPVATPVTQAKQKARRILIVEDSDDLRDTMRIMLERAGHATTVVSDGNAGLESLIAATPDLAFIDLGLPGIDGYEVARRARERLGNAVTLVALSGYGRAEDKARAIAAGFDFHLTKPIDGETLLRTAVSEQL